MQELVNDQPEAYQSSLVPEELPYDFQRHTEKQAEPLPPVMTAQTRLGLHLLAAALLAGVSGNMLLRATPWGVNIGIWVTIVAAAIITLVRQHQPQLLGRANWLVVPAIFFAGTFAWRDSITLNALSLLALLLIAMMVAMRARSGQLLVAGVSDYLQHFVTGVFISTFGPIFLIFSDIAWKELPRDGWSKKALEIGRGLAIAAPLLVIFGGLFVAADAVFENIIARTFNIDGFSVFTHVLLTALFAWLTAGFLRWTFVKSEIMNANATRPESLSLGIVETATVLSLLNFLFAAFVAVQFRYFFGGKVNIPNGRGFEYAEYARHGFFELVWVSVLVLPLLLGLHWLLRKDNPKHELIFRVLAGIKLALLSVIMLSAMQRMRLYQGECGLTELRVYTMAFMGWLGIVFLWFAATVLRGQRQRFAFGAIMTGLAMIAGLHLVNPDHLIVRVNLQRAKEGKAFDATYTASLSADSIPALAEGVGVGSVEAQKIIVDRLRFAAEQYQRTDWRSWNLARNQAVQAALKK
ncbi:MAG: DUF4173 domain-containing protein [Blastocatellia bacterium]|nr:DUF4173 domain-containing protein [Blastocatellia bacterium]